MDHWTVGLSAWIIQDGNYPDFFRGQRAEFAVEFYFPDPPKKVRMPGQIRAVSSSEDTYDTLARVVGVFESAWVLDCGIYAYSDKAAPLGLSVGDLVEGRMYLGVDPFFYVARLHALAGMPALVYTWRIEALRRQIAPFIDSADGMIRDPGRLGYISLDRTNAWHDDDGHADYLLECARMDILAKMSSATAT